MKKISLITFFAMFMLTLFAMKAEAQSGVSGKWNQAGLQNTYLIISSVSGNYTATYVMGQMICRFNSVSISDDNISMKSGYESGEGFYTDVEFNLTLSEDGLALAGIKTSDTHSTNRAGTPLHDAHKDPAVFFLQ